MPLTVCFAAIHFSKRPLFLGLRAPVLADAKFAKIKYLILQ